MKTLLFLFIVPLNSGSCNTHSENHSLIMPSSLPYGVEMTDSSIDFKGAHLNDAIKEIIQQYHYKGFTSASIKNVPQAFVKGGFNLQQSGSLVLKSLGRSFDLDIRVINDSVEIQRIAPRRSL